jgi:phytoene synthase
MELYTSVSYELAEKLTKRYSTSFSMSSQLFPASIRPAIYAIYGMVRIADEIVDTYRGGDALELLNRFEADIAASLKSTTGYSTNPIIHAFVDTAKKYQITSELTAPFFNSMRVDVDGKKSFTRDEYDEYIYGSAAVVGLMCLKVFSFDKPGKYDSLRPGAEALGRAYQKVNFLRDLGADYTELGRSYFPGISVESLTEQQKQEIIAEIEADFAESRPAINKLPNNAKRAVTTSYVYYKELLEKLQATPVEVLKETRIRITGPRKIWLLAKTQLRTPS